MPVKDLQPQLQHFERICKDAGLKVTHQRLEIYRELLEAYDHPSAEILHKRLEKRLPTLSLDTVYRTMATFEKLQLVHRVETVESQARFEARTIRHHHFLCDTCAQPIDFSWQAFDDIPLPSDVTELGIINRTAVVVHGICATCARKAKSKGMAAVAN